MTTEAAHLGTSPSGPEYRRWRHRSRHVPTWAGAPIGIEPTRLANCGARTAELLQAAGRWRNSEQLHAWTDHVFRPTAQLKEPRPRSLPSSLAPWALTARQRPRTAQSVSRGNGMTPTPHRRSEGQELIRWGVRRYFGGFAKGMAQGLNVRHDHDRNNVEPFSEGDCLRRHRVFACLCPRVRGQWLRRAVHPHAQGDYTLGPHLRDHRGNGQALLEFRETYNNSWLIQRYGFILLAAFRQQELHAVKLAA